MIGIYKITNKLNGKSYVGQSVDIVHRWYQHKTGGELAIGKAIQKYGVDNFIFEIIEECNVNMLDEREKYWILKLNTLSPNGYNLKLAESTRGEDNGCALLTQKQVEKLREIYNSKKYNSTKEVYENEGFNNIMEYSSFREVFTGLRWGWVMPEVFTIENKEYYDKCVDLTRRVNNQNGENNTAAILTEKEVLDIRLMYVTHERKDIFKKYSQYNERLLTSIISGQNWKHLPIYKKRQKKWIWKDEEYEFDEIEYLWWK